MTRLKKINETSNESIVDPSGPVVSLTSYGPRIDIVFYAIESIAQGQCLPSRLTLWLSEEDFEQPLPASLKRLQKRGLDIKACVDHGPHKKYFPEVINYTDSPLPFITADDDTIYPRFWLSKLINAYEQAPGQIYCFRSHLMAIQPDGEFVEYKKWQKCLSTQPSHLHFSTGDCGVLFPPEMREVLSAVGDSFLDFCPKADDIWLNYHSFKAKIPVSQVVNVPKRFYEVPGTRGGALSTYNNGQGGNDAQLANTYTRTDRQELLSVSIKT